MALGTWNARGNEYTVAWASGVAYCSRSRTALARRESAGPPLPACSSGHGE